MVMQAQLADGRVLEFPDGTDPSVIQTTVKRTLGVQPDPAAQERSDFQIPLPGPLGAAAQLLTGRSSITIPEAIGGVEAAATGASGIVAEPAGGIAGIGTALLTQDPAAAAAVVEGVSERLTFEPRTEEGRANIQSLARTLKPVTDVLQAVEKASGEAGFDLAGPVGGAIGKALPAAVAELLGIGTTVLAGRVTRRMAGAEPSAPAAEVLEAGVRLDVPVLTTDVVPPTTFLGKFTQQLSEKLGPLGTGAARADQQIARQNVVEELAQEFDVELSSPFAEEIVTSLNAQSAKVLANASEQRNRAVAALTPFGTVPVNKTIETIDRQLARQARLGEKANTELVNNLNDIKSSIGGDFSLVKDIRTEVISDLKALSRGEDRRAEGALQSVKSAIDEDLATFAKTNDRQAAADWQQSNRKFAEEFSRTRDTELKRILRSGEATPEKVLTILKGGKPSELKRLNKSLTPEGRQAARGAIVKDALDESGFFRGDVNPDRLATALNKTNRKQAIDAFFTGQDKKQLEGLTRLLDATRRAQQAAAAPPTGVQTIPLITTGGIGAGIATDAFTTMGTVGTLSAIAKAYESSPFRNLLLKIANSKPGSKVETGILEAAVPGVLAALQASKTEPIETESGQ